MLLDINTVLSIGFAAGFASVFVGFILWFVVGWAIRTIKNS